MDCHQRLYKKGKPLNSCPHKKNIFLSIAYDGTPYFGWQKTNAGPSVEGTLQKVLEKVLQHPVKLQAASRTDRGVHAKGQVVNFFTGKSIPSLLSLNRLLPPTLKILHMKEMPPSFHPSLDVQGKLYVYAICFHHFQSPFNRHYSWHFPYPLDIEEMKKGATFLIGRHDFSTFCNVHSNQRYSHKERRIDSIEFKFPEEKRLHIEIKGNHFLYKMVRNLAGILAYVGCGKVQATQIPELLKTKAKPKISFTAPANGLTLQEIYFAGYDKMLI